VICDDARQIISGRCTAAELGVEGTGSVSMRAEMNHRNTVCSKRATTLAAGLPLLQLRADCSEYPEPPTIEITRTPPASQGGLQRVDMIAEYVRDARPRVANRW
jgi:hypothetical protein